MNVEKNINFQLSIMFYKNSRQEMDATVSQLSQRCEDSFSTAIWSEVRREITGPLILTGLDAAANSDMLIGIWQRAKLLNEKSQLLPAGQTKELLLIKKMELGISRWNKSASIGKQGWIICGTRLIVVLQLMILNGKWPKGGVSKRVKRNLSGEQFCKTYRSYFYYSRKSCE